LRLTTECLPVDGGCIVPETPACFYAESTTCFKFLERSLGVSVGSVVEAFLSTEDAERDTKIALALASIKERGKGPAATANRQSSIVNRKLTPLPVKVSIVTMEKSFVRPPAVAGRFYPSDPESLTHALDACLKPEIPAERKRLNAKGCIVPHAGYVYSGQVAGAVYRSLPAWACYVILCPNHFGRGAPLAIISGGSWATPLGLVPVDESLSEAIKRNDPALQEDREAHAEEHSLEVQLPFLQREVQSFSFVPVAIGGVKYEQLESLGLAIASAIESAGRPVMIVASSDMNHYEPDAITRVKDRRAIDRILALSPDGLFDVVHREQISMCGWGPAVAMLVATRALGAKEALLEKYATSADAGGDVRSVVGYAGIVVR
jgi:AmmeMemoRadiSam system protein B